MELKIVETHVVESIKVPLASDHQLSQKRQSSFQRRKFLKFAGMASIGFSVAGAFNLSTPKKANAQCYTNAYGYTSCDYYNYWYYQQYQGYLMWAYLYQMSLYNSHYSLYQPISGSFRLDNDTNERASGEVAVTLVGRRSLDTLEDYSTLSYDIPARTSQTVEFSNGPSGQSPGSKIATIWTANANVSSGFTVS